MTNLTIASKSEYGYAEIGLILGKTWAGKNVNRE
jgi:hypothetical protein